MNGWVRRCFKIARASLIRESVFFSLFLVLAINFCECVIRSTPDHLSFELTSRYDRNNIANIYLQCLTQISNKKSSLRSKWFKANNQTFNLLQSKREISVQFSQKSLLISVTLQYNRNFDANRKKNLQNPTYKFYLILAQ